MTDIKNINKIDLLQFFIRGLVGAFMSGVGVSAKNHVGEIFGPEIGVILGIIMVFMGISLFYGLTLFGSSLCNYYKNIGYFFCSILIACIVAIFVSTILEPIFAILMGSLSCIVFFYKRIEVNI